MNRTIATTSKLMLFGLTMSLAALSSTASHAQSSVFADLSGNWSGGGSIQLEDGSNERIRCRATYAATGPNLNQSLTCASDSYRFELRSNVVARGTELSGSWSETSRNISGNVSGRASGGGRYDVTVSAPGFTANLALNVTGKKQVVQMRSQGEFRSVTINLTKS